MRTHTPAALIPVRVTPLERDIVVAALEFALDDAINAPRPDAQWVANIRGLIDTFATAAAPRPFVTR